VSGRDAREGAAPQRLKSALSLWCLLRCRRCRNCAPGGEHFADTATAVSCVLLRPVIDDDAAAVAARFPDGARAHATLRRACRADATRGSLIPTAPAPTRPSDERAGASTRCLARLARVGATPTARSAKPLARREQAALPLRADLLRTRAALFHAQAWASGPRISRVEINERLATRLSVSA
jgi:hypothetical protein